MIAEARCLFDTRRMIETGFVHMSTGVANNVMDHKPRFYGPPRLAGRETPIEANPLRAVPPGRSATSPRQALAPRVTMIQVSCDALRLQTETSELKTKTFDPNIVFQNDSSRMS
jgi:hypothetical protein